MRGEVTRPYKTTSKPVVASALIETFLIFFQKKQPSCRLRNFSLCARVVYWARFSSSQ